MSSRHFRKKNQQRTLPPPSDDSDEEYQPLYAQRAGSSKYTGLEVSSDTDSEHSSESSEADNTFELRIKVTKKKHNIKIKVNKKARFAVHEQLDDVERCVHEVNDILGALSPAPTLPVNQAQSDNVLAIDAKHLNVANELKQLFGTEEGDNRARALNRALLLKRVLVHPNKETPVYEFNNSGLYMTKQKEEDNCMYFVFNHSEEYQRIHRNFLQRLAVAFSSSEIVMFFDQARQEMHVEALLEVSDRLFRMEENGVANEIVENVVTFLQYVAHPLYILSQNKVRLDYEILENRPFHVAMLKYMYLLSNKACHRTALEIAKMMLQIDPKDPLSVMSLIDILALRSREHEWLIEAVKHFRPQGETDLLFNIMYSYSLAHFHVALKTDHVFDDADRLIRDAITAYPQIFVNILECNHISEPELTGHVIFKPDPQTPWSAGSSEMFMMYAKMTYSRWNESGAMQWLLKNATELCDSYNTNNVVQEAIQSWGIRRRTLFKVWPKEYLRHMSVFSSMSKLIIETSLTSAVFSRATCAWDPLFDESVNRYGYNYRVERPSPPISNVHAAGRPIFRFFHSMNPTYYDPPMEE